MYENPITRYTEDIMANIVKKEEGYLVESVHKVGFDIDKEELAKALRYDRDQYEKGFNDGRLSAESQWIPVTELLPKNDDWVTVTILDESGDTPYRYTDFGWYLEAADCWVVGSEQRNDVIAWMLLPKPWKGGGRNDNSDLRYSAQSLRGRRCF